LRVTPFSQTLLRHYGNCCYTVPSSLLRFSSTNVA